MAKNKKKSATASSGASSARSAAEPAVQVEGPVEVEEIGVETKDAGREDGIETKDEVEEDGKEMTAVKMTNGDVAEQIGSEKDNEPQSVEERNDDGQTTETTETEPTPDTTTQAPAPPADDSAPTSAGSDDEDDDEEEDDAARIARLEHDLDTTRAEKEQLGTQYRSLLSKLTTMRQSLGDRLREDAEELDRRELQIQQLSTDCAAAQETITSLRRELESAAEESTHLSAQVTQLRLAASTQSNDALSLTREMRELRGEMEMLRVEREQWEAEAERERERREAMEEDVRAGERQRREDEARRRRAEEEWEREKMRADNLQEVLADFQNGASARDSAVRLVDGGCVAKETEIQQATSELEHQLQQAVQSLAEWKTRAADAEVRRCIPRWISR
jgi:hypothetical protein